MTLEHCPREHDCAHKPELKLDYRGRCVDCGTQITERAPVGTRHVGGRESFLFAQYHYDGTLLDR